VSPGDEAEDDDDERGDPHSDGAEIVGPLGEIEAEDVEQGEAEEDEDGEGDEVDGFLGVLAEGGMEEEDVAGGEIEDGGEVGEIADPVHPGGEKAGLFAESNFSPNVEAAFGGIARREMDYGESKRNVEEEPGGEPDGEGGRAVAGGGGDPAEADAGDYVKEDEVAKAHDAGRSAFGERRSRGQGEEASRGGVGGE